jgi:hypothetical protein
MTGIAEKEIPMDRCACSEMNQSSCVHANLYYERMIWF